MISFSKVEEQAEYHHGSLSHIVEQVSEPLAKEQLIAIPDDRFLSELSKIIFQVGFNWTVVEKKWPAFEERFFGFKLDGCAFLSDEQLDAKGKSGQLIKNWPKLRAIRDNAIWLRELRDEHEGLGRYFVKLGDGRYCDAIKTLQKQGTRVGAKTAQFWLRRIGVDSLILSEDVVIALKRFQIIDKEPTSQKAWNKLQEALDFWQQESGHSLTYISRMLAFSTGPRR